MGIVIELDGMYDHEGYAARRLPDGTLTSTWTAQTRQFTGYVAACACGWHATSSHPPTDSGYDAATDQWYRTHANQVLGRLAQRDRHELAEVLRTLGRSADRVEDPANLDHITRAAEHARRLAEQVRQTTRVIHQREATEPEVGRER